MKKVYVKGDLAMTDRQKQNLLQYLGYYTAAVDGIWGEKSRQATVDFQRAFGLTETGDFDGATQKRILEAIASGEVFQMPEDDPAGTFWDDTEFFAPEEFKCKCGGKYCDGYPHEIQPLLVQICDRARRWSGHPIQVISGLRCETHNRNEKGVYNSQHMYGEAVDVFFYGVSPSAALAWLQSQPDVRYAYQIEGSNNIHFDILPVGR